MHKLKVIHNDDVQAMLGVEAAAFGAHLHGRYRRGIVNKDVLLGENAGSLGEFVPLVFLELAGAKPVRTDAGLRGNKPLHQLLVRHFQTENGDALFSDGSVARNVEYQRGFAHSRSAGDDDEIGSLQATQ